MAVQKWKVYLKCPHCGKVTVLFDYIEDKMGRVEKLHVLNIGSYPDPYVEGKVIVPAPFCCPVCGKKTPYDDMFVPGVCTVEDLSVYKELLGEALEHPGPDGTVNFSDMDANWGEEPALTHLAAMYPEDEELKKLQQDFEDLNTEYDTMQERYLTDAALFEEEIRSIEELAFRMSDWRRDLPRS